MTKVLRMLAGGGLAAVLGMVLLGLSGGIAADSAEAQAPPARPARFVGTVTIDGAPAPDGTVVEARIGTASCGVTSVGAGTQSGWYTLDVQALEPSGALACGTDGATVSFVVGGQPATVQGDSTWNDYHLNQADLVVVTATPTATPTGGTGTPTATATATPRPPVTGQGTVDSAGSSNAWLLAVLGAGVLAFGVGGAAVARRGR